MKGIINFWFKDILQSLPIVCVFAILYVAAPRAVRARKELFFAGMLTFMGGLREWPYPLYAWSEGFQNWHTEWWAREIGFYLQISSFYSTHFWAPQHVCGLALFGLLFYVLRTMAHGARAGFVCGLLLGIQAGFSVYVAIFSGLYVFLYICTGLFKSCKQYTCMGILLATGFSLAVLPLAPYFIGKQGTIFWGAKIAFMYPILSCFWPSSLVHCWCFLFYTPLRCLQRQGALS